MGISNKKAETEVEKMEDFDGLIGNGTGQVDTESENAKISFARLKELASLEPVNLEIRRKLLQIKWRMEDYLRDEINFGPNDVPSILNECIQAVAVRQKDFAEYIGIKPSNLSAMLKGNRSISPSFALKLEQIFDVSATLWLSVQIKNELDLLRKSKNLLGPKLSRTELLAKAS